VKTVGALSSGKYSPQRFKEIHGDVWHDPPDVSSRLDSLERPSLLERAWDIVGTPRRMAALAGLMGVCFLGGVAAAVVWNRWRRA